MNEEYLVSVIHQITLITSLPFVHTARRSYRSNDQMKCSDWGFAELSLHGDDSVKSREEQ